MSRHNARRAQCREVARISTNVAPRVFFTWKNARGFFFFIKLINIDSMSHCRPANRHGKPSSPPSTIAATETIEGLCRTLLPSDLLPVRRGRGWRQQRFDPVVHLDAIVFGCCGGRRRSSAAAAVATTMPFPAANRINNQQTTRSGGAGYFTGFC